VLQERGPGRDSAAAVRVESLWLQHAGRVRAYLHHQTDHATADDLVQEVFVVALRRLDDVPDPAVGWLLGTARFVLANHRRQTRRQRSLVDRAAAEPPAPHDDTTAELAARRAELDDLLTGLSARDREVLMLSAWYDLDTTEAARALGVSPNAYRVRLHRARARLAARRVDGERR
jgi:RNA polymerase sigma-70 factor, ECF subfamily